MRRNPYLDGAHRPSIAGDFEMTFGFPLYVPVIFFALVGLFAAWGSCTYQDGGFVHALYWEHHAIRENFHEVTREGWKADLELRPVVLPKNGVGEVPGIDNIRNCESKFHHTDRYFCGYSGSGKHRHAKYCHRPVYRDWCVYDTWDWFLVEDQKSSGVTTDTFWEKPIPGILDRVRHEGSYDVLVTYTEGEIVTGQTEREAFKDVKVFEHVHHPKTESDFRTWSVGERVMVECYNIGFVRDVIRIKDLPVE